MATGGLYRLHTADNGEGGTVTFTYEDIGQVLRPSDYVQAYPFSNYHRVTSRAVADGRGNTTTTTYAYENPEMNSLGSIADLNGHDPNALPNSAKLFYAANGSVYGGGILAVPARTEFRGHRSVTVTDAAGNSTKHAFYQGDLTDAGQASCTLPTTVANPITNTDACFGQLRTNEFFVGREYRVETYASGSTTALTAVTHALTLHGPSLGCQASQCDAGLWQGWLYENTKTETVQEGGAAGATKTTRYTYTDANGSVDRFADLLREDQYPGVPVAGTPPLRSTTYGYAFGTNFVRQARTVTLDGSGATLAQADALFDGLPYGQAGPYGDTTRTRVYYRFGANPQSGDTVYAYDSYGNRTGVTTFSSPNGPDGTGTPRTVTTTYDSLYHVFPTQVTMPAIAGGPFSESAVYDYRGLLTDIYDLNGVHTHAIYDAFGRLAKIVKPGDSDDAPSLFAEYFDFNAGEAAHYRVASRDTAGTGGQVHYTLHWYDGRGRTIQTKQETQYDGSQTIVTDARYNDALMQSQTSTPRAVNETATTFSHYDPLPATGVQWATTTTDALRRPILIVAPDGTQTHASYTASGAGVVAAAIDANGHKVDKATDVFGRMMAIHQYNGTANTGFSPYATTNYTYDALDRPLTTTDAAMNTTTTSYGATGAGRTVTTNDPDRGLSTVQYDHNEVMTSTTDALMQTIGYGYDAWDRLIATSGALTASYLYDADPLYPNEGNTHGKLVTTTGGGAVAHTTYDNRGRATSSTQTIGSTTASFASLYDDGDHLTALTYPGGEQVTYGHDAAGRPTSACTTAIGLCYAGNIGYTALSQPTTLTLGNTLLEQWSYDGVTQRLMRHQLGSSLNQPSSRSDRDYSYDAVGNVATIQDGLRTGPDLQHFTYDAQDRLTHAWTTGNDVAPYDESDTYDSVGDFFTKNGVTYSYSDTTGQPRPKHAPSTVGTDSYTYDAAGQVRTGGGRTITWNAQHLPASITTGSAPGGTPTATPTGGPAPANTSGRVSGTTSAMLPAIIAGRVSGTTSATQPALTAPLRAGGTGAAGVTESYTYDAAGQRRTRVHDGITTSYFGLYEKDSNGTERWYYKFGGATVAQREHTGAGSDTRLWLTGDHLGSTSLVTNGTGGVLSQTEYGPWGQERLGPTGGARPTALGYTGQLRDGTGLSYMGSRYYDPLLGRFLSPDSMRIGINPYAYVHNNPLNHTDPTGHCNDQNDCDPGGGGGGGGSNGGNGGGGGGGGTPGDPNNDPGFDPGNDPSPGPSTDPTSTDPGSGPGTASEPGNDPLASVNLDPPTEGCPASICGETPPGWTPPSDEEIQRIIEEAINAGNAVFEALKAEVGTMQASGGAGQTTESQGASQGQLTSELSGGGPVIDKRLRASESGGETPPEEEPPPKGSGENGQPASGTGSGKAGPHTPDQGAFINIVNDVTKGGRTPIPGPDVPIVIGWGTEVGLPGFRVGPGDMAPNPGNHWVGGPHIHVPGVGSGHVPIVPIEDP